jgi:hypothetical protein
MLDGDAGGVAQQGDNGFERPEPQRQDPLDHGDDPRDERACGELVGQPERQPDAAGGRLAFVAEAARSPRHKRQSTRPVGGRESVWRRTSSKAWRAGFWSLTDGGRRLATQCVAYRASREHEVKLSDFLAETLPQGVHATTLRDTRCRLVHFPDLAPELPQQHPSR